MEYAIKFLRKRKYELIEKFDELNEGYYADRFGREQVKRTQGRIDEEVSDINLAIEVLEGDTP